MLVEPQENAAQLTRIRRIYLDILLPQKRPRLSFRPDLLQLVVLDTQLGLLTRHRRLYRPCRQHLFVSTKGCRVA
jgi:hypothetical protein